MRIVPAMTIAVVKAPWTPEFVVALWEHQLNPHRHPYTCSDRRSHPELNGDLGVLIPTIEGWICQFCGYRQDWAHEVWVSKVVSP